ncbi:glycosyltransferase family 22 protein [Auriscalpium vulgare]|uniref:Glycosyltransferase family 22 protein n=1 Tax=Auriscalpium vulgare TaxID=40419 RepID=A0ACB8S0C5_9AGAM|nr:glycosyltransferase family 22 protein [Auriscalpium vulgare]
MSNFQTIRFRRPTNNQEAEKPAPLPPKLRHTGILQDQLRRAARPPWSPSFSLALRILMLVRFTAAMYSNIQDCDEVFNFWEPLHYLDKGYGFQTWETSPVYAIRSWAYIILYYLPARVLDVVIHESGKRPAFFMVRATLALISSTCEAKFYDTVRERINNRVARYMLFMLASSAGMWNASTALLPSTFAMYANTLACAYAFLPPSSQDGGRTLRATLLFATGALVGWPFALALAIPFVFEELFVFGGDRVPASAWTDWIVGRWTRLMLSGAAAAQIAIPVILIDTFFYGKVVAVPWNIVKYNVFPDAVRGPGLYGTSPWYFYVLNLLLNFNIVVPLALISLPALYITYRVDRRRLGVYTVSSETSSPFTLLALRLVPFYIWLGILTVQPHKEERFMYPAYPLLCFNAAVTTYLIRGWLEQVYIKVTKSPYRASKTSIFNRSTLFIVLLSMLISLSRIFALWKYYHTPMTIVYVFEKEEVPHLLNATGLLPHTLPPPELMSEYKARKATDREDEDDFDLALIEQFGLRICLGKEWHRFPGHYLVPTGVRVDWIKSEFDGLLPAHFQETGRNSSIGVRATGTSAVPVGLNDLNKEEPMHYVDVSSCDYLIDLDFPDDPIVSPNEPRYILDQETWDPIICLPFLDARHSSLLTRTLWLPGETWQSQNSFGDYCLLRNRETVARKIRQVESNNLTE